MTKRLAGQRIAALVGDGFEYVELLAPMKALRAAGATVDVIALHGGKVIGMNLDQPAKRVRVDRTVAAAEPADYDGLFIPGGLIGPDLLRQSHDARQFVRAFEDLSKPIASLCHGPWLLISAGVVRGRRVASSPGMRDDLVNAGAIWNDLPIVHDGNWVTSRSPRDLAAFLGAMINLFAEGGHEARLALEPAESSPQHREPEPSLAKGMVWLPRLARAKNVAATLGAVAATAVAVVSLRRVLG